MKAKEVAAGTRVADKNRSYRKGSIGYNYHLDGDEVVPEKLGCMLEAAILGYVLHVDIPVVIKRGYSTPLLGPLWSKKRKLWYNAPE